MSTKVLVMVPTYNERENIAEQLLEIDKVRKTLVNSFEMTVLNIDDNSPDLTAIIAMDLKLENFSQIVNRGKNGLGPAYISGFKWGLERGFDYFVEIDADGSHLASQLPELLTSSAHSDLVIGTRWMAGGKIDNWPWYRKIISKFGTTYASLLLRLPYRDLTSGYRVLGRDFLQSLDLDSISTKGYGFQIEIAFQAHVNGFRISQVPITFIERTAGKSKMSSEIAFEAFKYVTKLGFRRLVNRIIRR
ncbi:unannotated protein [freshwater metagenome]|uniref:Unannotated protein n=1 Tax=freshwater metagenome TaxID=449393 RepID=A0A6J6TBC5_9ZZZZ|nr:glycosyltransferase [Actinomycetota bacterium]